MNNFRRIWPLMAFICASISPVFSQDNWQIRAVAAMPEAVANNAVCGALRFGDQQVYSFAGIDASKVFSGIHLRSFRYDVPSDSWTVLPPLPDTLGKVAAGASAVGDVVYVIGGYHVFSDGSELSSKLVHRLHIPGDTFLTNGADIPVAIDDHVQAVYEDSLIFVVTGWSDNTNVPNVQIYDPANDQWLVGTSVPDNNNYKVFGASGAIVGDTIYYLGGARLGANFPGSLQWVKGAIDPSDPTQITWSTELPPTPRVGYRMASASINDQVYWFGGSETTYNYNGVAYNGSGGVEPSGRFSVYTPANGSWEEETFAELPMDLRGVAVASVPNMQMWVAGGMSGGQQVSDQTYYLAVPFIDGIEEESPDAESFSLFPNPTRDQLHLRFSAPDQSRQIRLLTLDGRILEASQALGTKAVFNLSTYPAGIYMVQVQSASFVSQKRFVRVD